MARSGILIIISALLPVLWACQKERADDIGLDSNDRIMFASPMLTVETRAGTGELKDALSPGDEFGVLGYCIPYKVGSSSELDYNGAASSWSTKRNYCAPNVFYKQKVTVQNSGCIYDYTGGQDNKPKYWYSDGFDTERNENSSITDADQYQYSFYAYYPYDGGYWTVESPDGASDAGAPQLTFSMRQPGGSDFTTGLDQSLTPDAMLAVLYNCKRGDGNLQFNFSHVLTGLRFVVNNYSESDLLVYSIKLQGHFFKKVQVDFSNTVVAFSFPTDRYTGSYILYVNTGGLSLPAPTEDQAGTSSDSILEEEYKKYIMLISGEGSYFGEDVQVVIDYKLGDSDRKTEYITRPGTFTPSPGVRYTAQLNFVGNAFVLQFVVDNSEQWENGGSDDGGDVVFE